MSESSFSSEDIPRTTEITQSLLSRTPPSSVRCRTKCARVGFILSFLGFGIGTLSGLVLATKVHSLSDTSWPKGTGYDTDPEVQVLVIFLANVFKLVALISLFAYAFFYRLCHASWPFNLFYSRHVETIDTVGALPICFSLATIANKVYFLNSMKMPVDDSSFNGNLFNAALVPNIMCFGNFLAGKFFQPRVSFVSIVAGVKTWRRNLSEVLVFLFFLYMIMIGNMWAYWQRNQALVNSGFDFTYTQILLTITFYLVTYHYGDAAVLNFVGGIFLDFRSMVEHPATCATGKFVSFCAAHPLVVLTNTFVVVIHVFIAYSHWQFGTDVQPFDFCLMARVGVVIFAVFFAISNVRIFLTVSNDEGWGLATYSRLRAAQMAEFADLVRAEYRYEPVSVGEPSDGTRHLKPMV